jgi:VWFA-related protein
MRRQATRLSQPPARLATTAGLQRANRIGPLHLLTLTALILSMPVEVLRAQDQPKISVEVKVVNVLATVRDKKGKIVSNLTKDDFVLEEDGKPQAITYFSRESDLPLTLVLLVDTSGSQRRVLDQERNASYSFLDQMMREKDMAFVIHFDSEVELLQDLTSSHKKLEDALGHLDELSCSSRGGGSGGSRGGYGGAGTLLYDAVYLASNEEMKKQQGRKALIILSDGVDHGSKESLATAIESAQRADTVVYSILFSDEESSGNPRGFGGMGGGMGGMGRGGGMGGGGRGGSRYPREERPDGKKILERISKETGGRLFEVTKKQPIDDIYSQIEEELRNQYSLGYAPAADAGAGYHKILLTTKQKDQIVQTRDGYYANAGN